MIVEKSVLAKLLTDKESIKVIDLDYLWFFDKKYREVAETLINLNGNYQSTNEIHMKIKENNPLTTVTYDFIDDLELSEVTSAGLEQEAKELQINYLNNKIVNQSKKYADFATESNRILLEIAIENLNKAKQPLDSGKIDLALDDIEKQLGQEPEKGISTYKNIDMLLNGGFKPGMLITIGARPGVGKTAFGVNLAVNILKENPDTCIDFFTLEMSKKQMLSRFISCMTEIKSYDFPTIKHGSDEQKLISNAINDLKHANIHVHDKLFDLGAISREIRKRRQNAKEKPYIAFIDYLGLIEARTKNIQRHLQVGEITREFKMMTNELGIPIILFSQLNREIGSRQDKTPILSDLRESGSIEQDSNVVMFIHQSDEQNTIKTEIVVAKNREGATAKLDFKFMKARMKFLEVF